MQIDLWTPASPAPAAPRRQKQASGIDVPVERYPQLVYEDARDAVLAEQPTVAEFTRQLQHNPRWLSAAVSVALGVAACRDGKPSLSESTCISPVTDSPVWQRCGPDAEVRANPWTPDGGASTLSVGGPGEAGSDREHEALCSEYCEAVGTFCSTAPTLAYSAEENCLSTCEHLPTGKANDATGNTVACRKAQALMAGMSEGQPTHCPAASPAGQGDSESQQCGTNCEAYCALWDEVCDDTVVARFRGDCAERCDVIYDRGAYNAATDFGAKDDTIQCRIAHLTAAAGYPADGPGRATHCGHAQLRPLMCPGDSAPCDLQPDVQPDVPAEQQIRVPLCTKYCDRMLKTCTSGVKIYDDNAQCEKLCERAFEHTDQAALAPNPAAKDEPSECAFAPDTTSDSVECRYWHVDAAWFEDDTTQCLHAGPDGGGHCGGSNSSSAAPLQ